MWCVLEVVALGLLEEVGGGWQFPAVDATAGQDCLSYKPGLHVNLSVNLSVNPSLIHLRLYFLCEVSWEGVGKLADRARLLQVERVPKTLLGPGKATRSLKNLAEVEPCLSRIPAKALGRCVQHALGHLDTASLKI